MLNPSGTKIRQARHRLGWTQQRLAEAIGTRERNIIRWENNQHSPRAEHLYALAEVTGNPVEFFLEDNGNNGGGGEDGPPADDLEAALMAAARLVAELVRREAAEAAA